MGATASEVKGDAPIETATKDASSERGANAPSKVLEQPTVTTASPTKRKATDQGDQPAKKGGFKGMDCCVRKQDFLTKAVNTTMKFKLDPKPFSNGTYGYQKGGGTWKIEADGPNSNALGDAFVYVKPSCIGHFLNSSQPLPSLTNFVKGAQPIDVEFEVWPCEFSSGSFGWHAHGKQDVTLGGKTFRLNLNVNAPIIASGQVHDETPLDPDLEAIDPNAIANHLPVIGQSAPKKDDLTKLRGIGPWIEARLNRIQVNSFKQVANMTMEIEKDVAVAIKYLPGRIHRDEWKFQASKMVKGKWQELNPLFPRSGTSQKVKVDGAEYEREMMDIADYSMKDGIIEFYEAEALWWSATDGGSVTPLERKTLQYILTSKKYKLHDEATHYLMQKLKGLK